MLRPRCAGGADITSKIEGAVTAMNYECALCGYVYDPDLGDTGSGIPRDTPFRALPDDWVCPECGAAKEDFERAE